MRGDESAPSSYVVNVSEEFHERPPTVIAQIKKLSKSFLDNAENIKTNIYPNELFIVEVLDESVSVGIISRKWLFLDIKYLKKYTFHELHKNYQRIIGKDVPYDRQWYEALENIITIISYETLYSLPRKIVIVDNRYSDLIKIVTKKGRFKDKEILQNLIRKEVEMTSGYKEGEIYQQITQCQIEKNIEKSTFIASLVEKEHYDKLADYLYESEFIIRRYHSIKSSLYASFFNGSLSSVMRIHVDSNIAYVMQKYKDNEFEYQQFNLEIDFAGIELISYSMDEVIVSGSGDYYERLKRLFIDSKIKIRTFNYHNDLNRCIIRLEKGVVLDTSFATIVGVAYHELFKINFSAIRLGVTRNLSIYEIMYNNLNILPFLFFIFVILSLGGVYAYFEYTYNQLSAKHKDTTELVTRRENLAKSVARKEIDIKNSSDRLSRLKAIFAQTQDSFDATVLHQIAQKLPNDMIVTNIEKKQIVVGRKNSVTVIIVEGKCFHERSLLDFINNLKFKNKEVYLLSLKDSKKTTFEEVDSNSIYENILEQELQAREGAKEELSKEEMPLMEEKLQEILRMNLEDKKVYFSDTLNNSFVLEIR